MRASSVPFRGIFGAAAAVPAFFFGGAFFLAVPFGAVFLAGVVRDDVIFPAFEPRRDLPEEMGFFMMHETLDICSPVVKPIF
ncbi:MAG: hypothetical protein ABIP20_16770 [Chthoniobacteraceae bacterium]